MGGIKRRIEPRCLISLLVAYSLWLVAVFGEVAEWPKAAVLKTVELKGSGGSNPSLSAIFKGIFRENHQINDELSGNFL